MAEYVYLMEGADAIKVGISDNPERRLSEVAGRLGAGARVVRTITCADRARAFELESGLHKVLAPYRLEGERFGVECFATRAKPFAEAMMDAVESAPPPTSGRITRAYFAGRMDHCRGFSIGYGDNAGGDDFFYMGPWRTYMGHNGWLPHNLDPDVSVCDLTRVGTPLPQRWDDAAQRRAVILASLCGLIFSDVVCVVGDLSEAHGTLFEIGFAVSLGIPVLDQDIRNSPTTWVPRSGDGRFDQGHEEGEPNPAWFARAFAQKTQHPVEGRTRWAMGHQASMPCHRAPGVVWVPWLDEFHRNRSDAFYVGRVTHVDADRLEIQTLTGGVVLFDTKPPEGTRVGSFVEVVSSRGELEVSAGQPDRIAAWSRIGNGEHLELS